MAATSPTRSIPRRERGARKGPNVDRALRGVPTARAELEAMGARVGTGDYRRPLPAS
jgi:hypothetical protein